MIEQPQPGVAVYRSLPQARLTHGVGASRDLLGALARAGAQRALVITGPTVAERTGLLTYVEQCLGPWHAGSFVDASSAPSVASIANATELYRAAEADALVSLGGGAAVDTAKAVAHALLEERGAVLPHVAVPTTLAGAAFSHEVVRAGEDGRVRRSGHPALVPREVFLDPVLTIETPPALWLSTGVAALGCALESLLSPTRHSVTDTLAMEAARTLFDALPRCAADPAEIEPRGAAQVAAWMARFSPATVPVGLTAMLASRLAGQGLPYGVAACALLPAVLRLLQRDTAERRADLPARLGLSAPLSDEVAELVRALGLPSRLRDTSMERGALAEVAEVWEEATMQGLTSITDAGALRALVEETW